MSFFPNAQQGFPFNSGVWGLMCSLDVAQPFATVRGRSREVAMAVPMASSATGVTFRGFQCRVASFRVAGMALRDIQTCFVTCRKSLCVAGAILLRRFQKMSSSFRGRRRHFGNLHRHVAWQAQHFRGVVLRVFCESHRQGCLNW